MRRARRAATRAGARKGAVGIGLVAQRRDQARGRRARGGRGRRRAGAARAGRPARRGIPGGRGCRCRTPSTPPRAARGRPASSSGKSGSVQAISAGGRPASRPQLHASSRQAASSGSGVAHRLRQQPRRTSPRAARWRENTTRAAPVARSRRRSATAAKGRSPRRFCGAPGMRLQRPARGGHDHAGQVARLLAPQHVVVDDGQRVAGLGDVHPRQRAPGAADQVEVAPVALGQPGRRAQLRLGDGAGAHRVAAGALGQADGADRQRGGVRHARRGRAAPVPGEPPPRSPSMPSAPGKPQQHAVGGEAAPPPRRTGRGSARRASAPAARRRSRRRCAASRTAAVASTSIGSAPHGAGDGVVAAPAPSAPVPIASSFSRPVVCRPRPRPSTAFSLKIACGLRPRPSNTTRRTELEPRSTMPQRARPSVGAAASRVGPEVLAVHAAQSCATRSGRSRVGPTPAGGRRRARCRGRRARGWS